MQKLFFISAISAISVISALALAQYPGRYVRKQQQPTFFVPAKDLDHTEKLPIFNYYPEQTGKQKAETAPELAEVQTEEPQQIQVLEVINEVDMSDHAPKTETPAVPNISVPVAGKTNSRYLEYDKNELAEIPEYKKKYDDYVSDLKIIAQTGNAPENPAVSQDLAKMSSNERLVVDDSFGLRLLSTPQPSQDIPEIISDKVIY